MWQQRISNIVDDIIEGKIKRDILQDSSLQFHGRAEGEYFSHIRQNMNSDMAFNIMHKYQQLDDLKILNTLHK